MDDALDDRMKELGDHISFAREWKALVLIKEELINLHRLNDARVKALGDRCDALRSDYNKLFVETRGPVNAYSDAQQIKKKGPAHGN